MASTIDPTQLESRLNHLLQTKVFNDVTVPQGQSRRQYARRALKLWYKSNHDCKVITTRRSWQQLKADAAPRGTLKTPHPEHLDSYELVPSSPRPCLVLDPTGRIIAYKFRVPLYLIAALSESSEQLPLKNAKTHKRGHFDLSHFALWADYSPHVFMSKEYCDQLPHSETFLQANQKLLDNLSNHLRLLSPELYSLYSTVDKHLSPSQKRLSGAWHGVAVNRQIGSTDELRAHKDWKDWSKGLNAVVPWGDYTGGGLTMYNLRLRWELKPGDVIFFAGRVVSHGVEEVTSGVRNSLDLFVHNSTVQWVRKQEKEAKKALNTLVRQQEKGGQVKKRKRKRQ
jgi:hypothetical protein